MKFCVFYHAPKNKFCFSVHNDFSYSAFDTREEARIAAKAARKAFCESLSTEIISLLENLLERGGDSQDVKKLFKHILEDSHNSKIGAIFSAYYGGHGKALRKFFGRIVQHPTLNPHLSGFKYDYGYIRNCDSFGVFKDKLSPSAENCDFFLLANRKCQKYGFTLFSEDYLLRAMKEGSELSPYQTLRVL